MENINIDTLLKKPIWQMTGEEFVGLLRSTSGLVGSSPAPVPTKVFEEEKYVFGLKGIRDLFGIGHNTAQRYKDTWLKPAVTQRGKKIMVDRELALQLFAQHHK